jgi:uncharacterized protein YjbJ (UPF0337 family)
MAVAKITQDRVWRSAVFVGNVRGLTAVAMDVAHHKTSPLGWTTTVWSDAALTTSVLLVVRQAERASGKSTIASIKPRMGIWRSVLHINRMSRNPHAQPSFLRPNPKGDDMDKDRIKGAADQARGAVKDVTGRIIGDAKLQAEGKAAKVKGKVESAIGDAKDAVRDTR